jgi:hypothetical protein
MKHAKIEDFIASFPHHILPRGKVEPDYHNIHAIHKLLQANAWAIDTHLGGGILRHLCIIVSPTVYAIVALTTLWENPAAPGEGPMQYASLLLWESQPLGTCLLLKILLAFSLRLYRVGSNGNIWYTFSFMICVIDLFVWLPPSLKRCVGPGGFVVS